MFLTYQYRLKDSSPSLRKLLREQSQAVNYIWNFCCEKDRESVKKWQSGSKVRRPTYFDLTKLTSGSSKELGVHSMTIHGVCRQFVTARDKSFPKTPKFRSFKRNTDWIPCSGFTICGAKISGSSLIFMKRKIKFWKSREIPSEDKIKTFSFTQDLLGHWVVNFVIELPVVPQREIETKVGIDLGLKTFAALSDGNTIETPSFYRKTETKLKLTQKRKQKKKYKRLSRKIKNQRKNFLHKASTDIVRKYDEIFIGDVSSTKLSKTRMSKSVYDAGWSTFKQMLYYKSKSTGALCKEINEKYSSVTCSSCNTRSGPSGLKGLRIRTWECSECLTFHNRDVNAAKNILKFGLACQSLVEETLVA